MYNTCIFRVRPLKVSIDTWAVIYSALICTQQELGAGIYAASSRRVASLLLGHAQGLKILVELHIFNLTRVDLIILGSK